MCPSYDDDYDPDPQSGRYRDDSKGGPYRGRGNYDKKPRERGGKYRDGRDYDWYGDYRRGYPKRFRGYQSMEEMSKLHPPADPNNTIGIFGFGQYTTEDDIKKLLRERLPGISGYTYKLIVDERSGFCRGFCFVDFKSLEDAIVAREILNFESFRGSDFKCDFSYKQRASGDGQPYD